MKRLVSHYILATAVKNDQIVAMRSMAIVEGASKASPLAVGRRTPLCMGSDHIIASSGSQVQYVVVRRISRAIRLPSDHSCKGV